MSSTLKTYRYIFKHIFSYIWLFIASTVAVYGILIPIFTLIGSVMLRLARVRYISNTNLIEIISQHPVLDLGLILLILAVIVAIYWQVTFLFLGTMQINYGKKLTIDSLLRLSIQRVRKTFFRSVWFLLIYCILILPFGGLGFSTPLLNKIRIPSFLVDYFLTENRPLLLVMILLYVVTFYLGIRLFLVLPLIILGKRNAHTAVKQSWQITKINFKPIVLRLVLLFATTIVVIIAGQLLVLGEQTLFDRMTPTGVAFLAASVNLILIEFFMFLSSIAAGAGSLMIMTEYLAGDQRFTAHTHRLSDQLQELSYNVGNQRWIRIIAGLLVIGGIGFNSLYLTGFFSDTPITISHRGVNAKNGVQNTIESLKNTSRLHPDFIEIDIHETKDHQFVLMHDENLKNLTGVDKAPHQLTLKQLTKLTAHENGSSAKIASLDDYMDAAEKLKQPLLIEFKTTKYDDPKVVERFNAKYGQRILKNHDQVHSLDYDAVEKLKELNPKLTVGYILPFNFIGVPQSSADFYTMEYSTLNNSFLLTAELTGRKVYAWTVNSDDAMARLNFMGVDGIITDKLELLQKTVKQLNHHPSYGSRLINFTYELGS
ncbi:MULTISPECIES: glycerophosphodiester phosphodiesterase [Pediococcus]|uniref:Membrane domain of membrane-anchored glycerophosphoryl diester phosphodiesterase n=1 Tax=Pediococcus pentosaceus (strain ATCC 25745 / CCUG 21536 / LMG 10740 / 183-1w) TaxID=278197 RepID=Q03I21_PEDPA|nr:MULTISPECIES: glycerophosphodiester phosphodiesterase [Pediococcus]ABJ67151.1 Membrane domain of membrane-anchored glycerophosphoryl diester phosphodiesterase [Pediococcus pentosaceus ATCC 25745]KAF5439947.1 glycerophosphoryl diester phosphodiesterase membrane domain-containing protein [Pediococcus sp. EKM202D]KAF5440611.1 glycerophosphoryl diester phosphodiesterase membrane domain-containing protein [Pediococcus sp. EKM201D]QHM65302.1 Glycerophosphodiester phosphodiesterase [Pediococcus pen